MAKQTDGTSRQLRMILRRYLTGDEIAEIERNAWQQAIAQLLAAQSHPQRMYAKWSRPPRPTAPSYASADCLIIVASRTRTQPMPFQMQPTPLPGVYVVANDAFRDERGFFREVFRADRFRELGLPAEFMQDNHSGSKRGVVRGLHFQWQPPMGKLMRVTVGAAFLVAVDIRKGSPTLGKWVGIEASAENGKQLWAPPGFARGFCALSDCEVQYKCTGVYNSQGESGIRWNDPAIGVAWPVANPSLSAKDAAAQSLAEWLARPESDRFRFDPAHPNQ